MIIVFSPKTNWIFRKKVALNIMTKLTQEREGGWANADMADKGSRGGGRNSDIAGGVWTLAFWDDIICEEPLQSFILLLTCPSRSAKVKQDNLYPKGL